MRFRSTSKPVGCDLKFCPGSCVFLLIFSLADRRQIGHWLRPKAHITNGQVRSLCNWRFVCCYPTVIIILYHPL